MIEKQKYIAMAKCDKFVNCVRKKCKKCKKM